MPRHLLLNTMSEAESNFMLIAVLIYRKKAKAFSPSSGTFYGTAAWFYTSFFRKIFVFKYQREM